MERDEEAVWFRAGLVAPGGIGGDPAWLKAGPVAPGDIGGDQAWLKMGPIAPGGIGGDTACVPGTLVEFICSQPKKKTH